MKTIQNPNFSIVLPGTCNAKCDFCFWEYEESPPPLTYFTKLQNIMTELPLEFNQVSITGGEPTISPYFEFVLPILKNRFEKVVLTTNGANLKKWIPSLEGIVDHVNISRHSNREEKNNKVFNAKMIAPPELNTDCTMLNDIGIDVTLSAVVNDLWCVDDVYDYIRHAKGVGASKVAFRIPHGSIAEHPLEASFSKIKYKEHNCGVCRHRTQLLNGMSVTWKASILEPSNEMDMIYELIMHQNGKLTSDWAGKNIIDLKISDQCDQGEDSGCGSKGSFSRRGC